MLGREGGFWTELGFQFGSPILELCDPRHVICILEWNLHICAVLRGTCSLPGV